MKRRAVSLVLCILLAVAWMALAEERYPELIGSWINTDHPNCTPCQLSIKGVQEDGTLILEASVAGDTVESWGRVQQKGKEVNISITMAGDSKFELSPDKGKYLTGRFIFYTQPSNSAAVRFIRDKTKK